MAVQDDRREEEQIELFDLQRPSGRSRDGTDAELDIGGQVVEFELKSTTKNTVTTVRDFGMNHIRKWEGKHWIFGFYTPGGKALKFTRYASPAMMAEWIEEKKQYIALDYALAQIVPEKLDLHDLEKLLGRKETYAYDDARFVHKNQLKKNEYQQLFDVEGGYSPERMLEVLRWRAAYIIERGSTLNNPHIPVNVLNKFPKITQNHGSELRRLVVQELKI